MQRTARLLAGLLAGTWLAAQLAACSLAPAAPADAPQPRAARAADAPPVISTWSADTLGDLLVAEVAGQRGQLDTALDAYLRQARTLRDPALAARATRIAWYARQPARVREAATLWAELAPGDPEANANAVMGLIQAGEIEAAGPLLDRLLADEAQPVRFSFLVQYAQEADAGVRQRVGGLLAGLSERHPRHGRLWLARAALAEIDGDLAGALAFAQRGREFEPDYPPAHELEGRLLAATGKLNAARRVLGDASERFPRERELRLAHLRVLLEAGRGDDARRELTDMLAQWPDDGDLALSLALVEWETGNPDVALLHMVELAETGFREDDAWMYAGRIAASQQRHEDAAGYFQNVRGAQFLQAQVQVAYAWQRSGRLADARHLLAILRQQAPDAANQLHIAESELLWRAKQPDESLAVLDRALESTPGDDDLRYAHALAAERLGRIDLAEADLRAILARQPESAMALNALGYTLADRTDRHAEAHDLISRALALSPDDPAIMDSMGWVLFRLGRLDEAIPWLRRAYALSPDAEIAAHLGEVLWAAGQRREARRVWNRALARDPDSLPLKRTRERLDR